MRKEIDMIRLSVPQTSFSSTLLIIFLCMEIVGTSASQSESIQEHYTIKKSLSPEAVGKLLTENLLSRDHMFYGTEALHYSEACAAVGALRYTAQVKDKETLAIMMDECIKTRERVLTERGDDVPSMESLREYYEMIFSAPVYVLVLVDKTVRYKGYEDKDGSLAASYIILGATALGYGSVYYTDSIPEDVCMGPGSYPNNASTGGDNSVLLSSNPSEMPVHAGALTLALFAACVVTLRTRSRK